MSWRLSSGGTCCDLFGLLKSTLKLSFTQPIKWGRRSSPMGYLPRENYYLGGSRPCTLQPFSGEAHLVGVVLVHEFRVLVAPSVPFQHVLPETHSLRPSSPTQH
ncbi:hypothetical protein GEV33_006974 [Tenebrio molitor]|uniref:Uncharacterized protein n=1 Tax=Tenebrio molitor TaxID=7067 RepID=A0A8J6HK66_TENMO|nr:hypothetical protein GEV33_006974 [Tenebrio molitor]